MKLFLQIWASVILFFGACLGIFAIGAWLCSEYDWMNEVFTGLLVLAMTGALAGAVFALVKDEERREQGDDKYRGGYS